MLFWGGGGVLGQIRTINNNNNNKNNNDKTTRQQQQQQQQQQQEKTTTTTPAATHRKQQPHKQEQNKQQPQKKNKQTTGQDKNRDPEKNKKWTKLPPNCSGLKNRAENRAHPPNAFRLQKQAFQKIKTQNFTKCTKKAFFTHKYSSNWYMHYTAAQCDLKKHYFYKGSTPSDWNRAQLSRPEIQVCVSTKLSSWPMGWAICDFLPFCCCHIFPLKCLFLQCETRVGPEPALRWTPNRHVFWKKRGPQTARPEIYIYIYIYIHRLLRWVRYRKHLAKSGVD